MIIELLLALLAIQDPAAQEPVAHGGGALAIAEIEGVDPLLLAGRVLPPGTAAVVTGGWVRRQWLPGRVYQAMFWGPAEPDGPSFCTRPAWAVEFRGATRPGEPEDKPLDVGELKAGRQYALAYPEPASEARCSGLVDGFTGSAPENKAEEQEKLLQLVEAMRQAGTGAPLTFELSCWGERPENCADPRAALVGLPLHRLLFVRLQATAFREDRSRPGVTIRYALPPDDGRWSRAEIHFDMDGPTTQSWIVTVEGRDRLEAIRLRRTTVIRH